jgi:DNA repair exonuclease SbcCD ATPase subunit
MRTLKHVTAILALSALGAASSAQEGRGEKAQWKEKLERREQEIRRHVDGVRAEIERVLETARAAAQRGEERAAADLEAKAREMKERLELERQEMIRNLERDARGVREEAEIREIERHLEKVLREVHAASERGDRERAEGLEREARAIREKLDARRGDREGREREQRGEKARREDETTRKELERAKSANADLVRKYNQALSELQMKGKEMRPRDPPGGEAMALMKELERKLVAIKDERGAAKERSDLDLVGALDEKGRRIRQEMDEIRRGIEARGGPELRPNPIEELLREVREMRGQLDRIEGLLREIERRR